MKLTSEVQAALVAAIQGALTQAQALTPEPDTNPLQEQLDAALAERDQAIAQRDAALSQVENLQGAVDYLNGKLEAGRVAAAATVTALAAD